jgi:mRNA-degrading endonuclease RelE of RelBE toxin-antitoxin system
VAQPFEIEFTHSALDDLPYLRRTDQTRILDSVGRHLSSEPTSAARNRKSLRPNSLAAWELRIVRLRAFYDVDLLRNVVLI